MHCILEGPDGAGKSTLARQLQARFGLHYHHEGVPPQNISALDHYGAVLEGIRRTGQSYVIDRFALGERVYGPIYRGHDGLGAEGWRVVQRQIRACAAVQILCLPSYEVCHDAWASGREEMYPKLEQFRHVYHAYNRFKDGQILYDYTQYGSYGALERVLEMETWESWPPGIIGSTKARYLFVGAQGSNKQAAVDLPFWYTKNSSGYLTKSLDKAGYIESEIAFINAFTVHGTPNKIPMFNPHGEPLTVIALGAVATTVCRAQRIENLKLMSHPQYFKRFFSKQQNIYIDQLHFIKQNGDRG